MKRMMRKEAWIALAFLGLGFAACKEDIHDFNKQTPAEPTNLSYIADKEKEFVFNLTVDRATGEVSGASGVEVKMPVHLSHAALSESRITVGQDFDLVSIYNAALPADEEGKKAVYYSVPSDLFEVSNGTLTVPEGATRSRDSVTVKISKPLKTLAANLASQTNVKGYLIPMKIRNFRGTDVGIDYAKRRSFVVINITFEDNE